MAMADTDEAKATHLRHILVGIRKGRQYLEQVMIGGKMAAEQIERDKTFAERVRGRLRA